MEISLTTINGIWIKINKDDITPKGEYFLAKSEIKRLYEKTMEIENRYIQEEQIKQLTRIIQTQHKDITTLHDSMVKINTRLVELEAIVKRHINYWEIHKE
jgi:hypothetical protein